MNVIPGPAAHRTDSDLTPSKAQHGAHWQELEGRGVTGPLWGGVLGGAVAQG